MLDSTIIHLYAGGKKKFQAVKKPFRVKRNDAICTKQEDIVGLQKELFDSMVSNGKINS
jgi:hypothetical protein